MVNIIWNRRLKEKFGYIQAKDIDVRNEECFKRQCFRAHDWNHDGHLLCWMREQGECLEISEVKPNYSQ